MSYLSSSVEECKEGKEYEEGVGSSIKLALTNNVQLLMMQKLDFCLKSGCTHGGMNSLVDICKLETC